MGSRSNSRSSSTLPRARPAQGSFDDLGTPLADVTFCVIDLETTGGDPEQCAITEIGAVKLRGGECLGTFQTLVNPGRAIPPTITILTGITEAMVVQAPRIETVLGTLVDFIGDAVIVGHNVSFDMGFIRRALERDQRDPLTNVVVDTVSLSRRLLRDEVPNCRLGTLAERLRLPNRPSHRALDDALATGDLLHVLLDRAGSLGVRGLDDLRSLPTMAGHPQAAKLRLTERLPRSPGVYLFRTASGRVLYVGKATNLRSRVRSYFSTDERRKIGSLLRQTDRIDHKRCATAFEAAVLEVRLIHHCEPPFNVEANRWRAAVYVKLTAERFPRLCIVKEPKADGATYVGPIGSRRVALLVIEAVESVVPLRRCTSRSRRSGPCIPAQLGLSRCTCTNDVTEAEYASIAATARTALTSAPHLVVDPLTAKMHQLAAEQRFEEAASTRDRLRAFVDALRRQRGLDRLRDAAVLDLVDVRTGDRFELRRGRLARHWSAGERAGTLDGIDPGRPVEALPDDPGPSADGPLARDLTDELVVAMRWLDRNAASLRARHVVGTYCDTLPQVVPVGGG